MCTELGGAGLFTVHLVESRKKKEKTIQGTGRGKDRLGRGRGSPAALVGSGSEEVGEKGRRKRGGRSKPCLEWNICTDGKLSFSLTRARLSKREKNRGPATSKGVPYHGQEGFVRKCYSIGHSGF